MYQFTIGAFYFVFKLKSIRVIIMKNMQNFNHIFIDTLSSVFVTLSQVFRVTNVEF